MSDVFISYARQDRPLAEKLARALNEQGYSVWWDREIPTGKSFRDIIQHELDQAKCIVVIWSKSSVKSHWVIDEASIGLERDILIPVRFESVELPLGFRSLHTSDLSGWKQLVLHSEYVQFLKTVQNCIVKNKLKYLSQEEQVEISEPISRVRLVINSIGEGIRRPIFIYSAIVTVLLIIIVRLAFGYQDAKSENQNNSAIIEDFVWSTPTHTLVLQDTNTAIIIETPTPLATNTSLPKSTNTLVPSLTPVLDRTIPYWHPKETWFPPQSSIYSTLEEQNISLVTNEKASWGNDERLRLFQEWGRVTSFERYYSHPDQCNSPDIKNVYIQIIFFEEEAGAVEFYRWAHADADVEFTDFVGENAYYYTATNHPETDCDVDYVSVSFQRFNAFSRVKVRSIPGTMTMQHMRQIVEPISLLIDQIYRQLAQP